MDLVKLFRIIGALEGISLLLLFFYAMPMKYGFGDPLPVRVVGSIHGFLFMAYVFIVFILSERENWTVPKKFLALLLSSVPFGTWIFERKHWKK